MFLIDYKTKEMCAKVVDDYAHALKFVPDRYKIKEMRDKLLLIILLFWNIAMIGY